MEFNKVKYIEQLLEKYLEATTTVAEEQELQQYFTQDNVAPHLEEYRMMFSFFTVAKEERFTKNVPLTPEKRNVNYRKWISVAAVAVMIFGAYFGVNSYQQYQQKREAEIAYAETKQAFELLAMNLQKSKVQMGYLNEIDETTQKIFKPVNK